VHEKENKAIIRRWIEEGWNRGNLDVADELYAADFFAESMEEGIEDLRGIEDVKEMVRRIRTAFPDIRFSIDYLIAEGDKVVGAFTLEGTQQGDLSSISPKGKRVSFKAIDIWRLQDGKIAERCTAVADHFSLLRQLGAIPPMT
jgi:steroid delta-isomerase-like uncharacterized protein